MTYSGAHHGLRYMIRSSGAPEVNTNNLLHSLLQSSTSMRRAFLEFLSSAVGTDLKACAIEREASDIHPLTGKMSFRDFRLSAAGKTRCIIETKIDSALTSDDQASRYLAQIDPDGALILVTRAPLVRALAAQAENQLKIFLDEKPDLHVGTKNGRTVAVMSWTHLLRGVTAADGTVFEELAALDAALEDIDGFVPFTGQVSDPATGQMVRQILNVADGFCAGLESRLRKREIGFDSILRKSDSRQLCLQIKILGHTIWAGYDATYWSTIPGDPDDSYSGDSAVAEPSPFWVGRYAGYVKISDRTLEEIRRDRLDDLGVIRPLAIPLGAPQAAVLDALLTEAVDHIARISRELFCSPELASEVAAFIESGRTGEVTIEPEEGIPDLKSFETD